MHQESERERELARALAVSQRERAQYAEQFRRMVNEEAARRKSWVRRAAMDILERHPQVGELLLPPRAQLRADVATAAVQLAMLVWQATERAHGG